MVVFFTYVDGLIIAWNLGYYFNMGQAILPATGALFIFIGTILKHIKRNWFLGIRTPWTLTSDEVWEKTHKMGSRLFVASGILAIFSAYFEGYSMFFVLFPILFSVLYLFLYSYLVYKK
ncbi:MAG: hypothetical protein COU51_01040 [Parcubacteria group bacterium CG10_big_fil_rev_8_21_14_0_10_36_14]|nr:MAG: hypothetical protein COU51_01040 [Parcubacteria group bacterium CG10_big_fil_rev_8_21_14_0_10_36_14]